MLFDMDLSNKSERAIFDGLDRDMQASYEAQANYYPNYGWFPDNRHVAIWGKGRLWRIDMDTGDAAEIPFRVTAEHRITEPVPVHAGPRACAPHGSRDPRSRAVALDGRTLAFTALARLWLKSWPDGQPRHDRKQSCRGLRAIRFRPTEGSSPGWNGTMNAVARWSSRVADGSRPGAIATSRGVIREPRFSPDGRTLVYRIQASDPNMGGARAKAGIYRIGVDGSGNRFVAAGNWRPQFSPDGSRIYFIEMDQHGESPAEVLVSVTTEGLDHREHARTPDADTSELRPEPGPALHRLPRPPAVLRDALARDRRATRGVGGPECVSSAAPDRARRFCARLVGGFGLAQLGARPAAVPDGDSADCGPAIAAAGSGWPRSAC